MGIFCFGLSHQTAAVDVRKRFVIPGPPLPDALMRLKSMPGLHEGLIVPDL
jgi:glutamyl-tRNA reductase